MQLSTNLISGNRVPHQEWNEVATKFNYRSPFCAHVSTTGDNTKAEIGDINRPFSTLAFAINAMKLVGGGLIQLGVGEFYSPTSPQKTNGITIRGSFRPDYNTKVIVNSFDDIEQPYPTALAGGTIIHGTLSFEDSNNIIIENLGLDNGSVYINSIANGADPYTIDSDGIVFNQWNVVQNQYIHTGFLNTGNIVRNVTILNYSPTKLGHNLLMENCDGAIMENIRSIGASHGIVNKSNGTTIKNCYVSDSYAEGINCKSNDIQAAGLFTKNTFINNVQIRNCNSVGILLDNSHPSATGFTNVIIDGFIITGSEKGICTFSPLNGTSYENIRITNGYIKDSIRCIEILGAGDGFVIDGVSVDQSLGFGIWLEVLAGKTANIRNCDASNTAVSSFYFDRTDYPVYSASTTYTTGTIIKYSNQTYKATGSIPINSTPGVYNGWEIINGVIIFDNLSCTKFGGSSWGIQVAYAEVHGGSFYVDNPSKASFGTIIPLQTAGNYVGSSLNPTNDLDTINSGSNNINNSVSFRIDPAPLHTPDGVSVGDNVSYSGIQQGNDIRGLQIVANNTTNRTYQRSGFNGWSAFKEIGTGVSYTETDPLSVHLTGNQSVVGEKTFTDSIYVAQGANKDHQYIIFDGSGYTVFGVNKSGGNNGLGIPDQSVYLASTSGLPILLKTGSNVSLKLYSSGIIELGEGTPTYANDAAAGTGGLTVNQLYKTPSGAIMSKL